MAIPQTRALHEDRFCLICKAFILICKEREKMSRALDEMGRSQRTHLGFSQHEIDGDTWKRYREAVEKGEKLEGSQLWARDLFALVYNELFGDPDEYERYCGHLFTPPICRE